MCRSAAWTAGHAGRPGRVRCRPGEHRPALHHEGVVVCQIADLADMLADSEVLDEVAWAHDRLGLENCCGSSDSGQCAKHSGEVVNLWLVLAIGAHALPRERDGIEAQDLDAEVREIQDDVDVLPQHRRVGPVDIPLPGIEGGPHPAADRVIPGEAARREVGEDLRQRPLVGVRLLSIGIDVEVVAICRISRLRAPRPIMFAGNVVQH